MQTKKQNCVLTAHDFICTHGLTTVYPTYCIIKKSGSDQDTMKKQIRKEMHAYV